jgi:hypothetical protein
MATDIHKLIAAISPDTFCDPSVRSKVKSLVKTEGYLKAAEKAKVFKSDLLFDYDSARNDPMSKWGLKSPTESHKIVYDSMSENLEPLYFWILDFLNGMFSEVEKITDNFISSPGSGQFSELMGKATQMQQQASKLLGDSNTVLRSILNLLYDLKEFKLKLNDYDRANAENPQIKKSGLLSLKQSWMDNVDIKRGNSSVKVMSTQFDFVTLLPAFMSVNSVDEVKDLDLNNVVKNIVLQRIAEFLVWRKESESALRSRFEIEKKYLASQVNSLKLYARWIKPYLKAAKDLEQKESKNAALVSTFNTTILELTLLAKTDYSPEEDVDSGILPEVFKKIRARKYTPLVIIELNFRGMPQRVTQKGDYSYGGRTEIKFTSYALNDSELKVLNEELGKDDLREVMRLIEGATTESLGEVQKDIDEFLEPSEKKEKKTKKTEDVNPFGALFSFLKKKEVPVEKEDLSAGIKSETEYEKVIRSQAILDAREKCFTIFDVYKKSHGMVSHTSPFEQI